MTQHAKDDYTKLVFEGGPHDGKTEEILDIVTAVYGGDTLTTAATQPFSGYYTPIGRNGDRSVEPLDVARSDDGRIRLRYYEPEHRWGNLASVDRRPDSFTVTHPGPPTGERAARTLIEQLARELYSAVSEVKIRGDRAAGINASVWTWDTADEQHRQEYRQIVTLLIANDGFRVPSAAELEEDRDASRTERPRTHA